MGENYPDALSSWRTALCSQWSRCGWLWVPSVGGRGKDTAVVSLYSIPNCVYTLQIIGMCDTLSKTLVQRVTCPLVTPIS